MGKYIAFYNDKAILITLAVLGALYYWLTPEDPNRSFWIIFFGMLVIAEYVIMRFFKKKYKRFHSEAKKHGIADIPEPEPEKGVKVVVKDSPAEKAKDKKLLFVMIFGGIVIFFGILFNLSVWLDVNVDVIGESFIEILLVVAGGLLFLYGLNVMEDKEALFGNYTYFTGRSAVTYGAILAIVGIALVLIGLRIIPLLPSFV